MATARKNWHATHRAQLTFGQRIADTVAATMGSWSFVIVQSVILAVWIVLNGRNFSRNIELVNSFKVY